MEAERFVGARCRPRRLVRRGRSAAAAVGLAVLAAACGGPREGYVVLGDGPSHSEEVLSRNIDVGAGLDLDPGRGAGIVVEAHPGGEWRLSATGDVLESGYFVEWDLVASLARERELEVLDDGALDEADHLRRIDRGAVRLYLVTGYGDDPPLSRASTGDAGAADAATPIDGGAEAGADGGAPVGDGGAPVGDGGAPVGDGGAPVGDGGAPRRGDLDVLRLRAPEGASLQVDVIMDGYHDASYVTWVGDGAVRAGAPSNPIVFVPVAP